MILMCYRVCVKQFTVSLKSVVQCDSKCVKPTVHFMVRDLRYYFEKNLGILNNIILNSIENLKTSIEVWEGVKVSSHTIFIHPLVHKSHLILLIV